MIKEDTVSDIIFRMYVNICLYIFAGKFVFNTPPPPHHAQVIYFEFKIKKKVKNNAYMD